MAFEYVTPEEAIDRGGLRMVVVGGIPSAWGEAAKGILHIKGIKWVAVRLDYKSAALKKWAGQRSGPVAVYEQERPRSSWAQILLLAERLAPTPALIPADAAARALVFGLAHEMCGESGLGWSRRLQLVHWSLQDGNGFAKPVAEYLAKKYGYRPETSAQSSARVIEILSMLASRLKKQSSAGSPYYVGESLTAVDVYSAAFMAMFSPLSPDLCPMDPSTRRAFESMDSQASPKTHPILIEHRDLMYAEHLELPLSL